MKTSFTKTASLILFVALLSFGVAKAQIDANATTATKALYSQLKDKGFNQKQAFFGQEFGNCYSKSRGNAYNNATVSDIFDVRSQNPAVLGFDFSYFSTDAAVHIQSAKSAYNKCTNYNNRAIITADFHIPSKNHPTDNGTTKNYNYTAADQYLMYNIGENNNTYGEVTWFNQQMDIVVNRIANVMWLNDGSAPIPVVLRLFHEMNGNWFWWGTNAYGGYTSYIKMYKKAVDYIKAHANFKHNILFEWCPDTYFTYAGNGRTKGQDYYPGNAYVDIIGLDAYNIGVSGQGYSVSEFQTQLGAMVDFAWNQGTTMATRKVTVLAEVGLNYGGRTEADMGLFWKNMATWLYGDLTKSCTKIAWISTWINSSWELAYVPHSGSTASVKGDFNTFAGNSHILWANTIPTDMFTTIKSASIEQDGNLSNASEIIIYPNPAINQFTIDLSSIEAEASVAIYDLQGKLIYTNVVTEAGKLNISTTGLLTSGYYIVKVNTGSKIYTQKLIVQ